MNKDFVAFRKYKASKGRKYERKGPQCYLLQHLERAHVT